MAVIVPLGGWGNSPHRETRFFELCDYSQFSIRARGNSLKTHSSKPIIDIKVEVAIPRLHTFPVLEQLKFIFGQIK